MYGTILFCGIQMRVSNSIESIVANYSALQYGVVLEPKSAFIY